MGKEKTTKNASRRKERCNAATAIQRDGVETTEAPDRAVHDSRIAQRRRIGYFSNSYCAASFGAAEPSDRYVACCDLPEA